MTTPKLTPLTSFREYSPEEMIQRAAEFCAEMQQRRTVRQFSPRPVSREIIEQALLVVGYPRDDADVPAITKKPLADIATFL